MPPTLTLTNAGRPTGRRSFPPLLACCGQSEETLGMMVWSARRHDVMAATASDEKKSIARPSQQYPRTRGDRREARCTAESQRVNVEERVRASRIEKESIERDMATCNVMWAVIRRSFCRVEPLPWCCSLLSSLLLLDVDYFNCPSLDLPASLCSFLLLISSSPFRSFFLYILSFPSD